MSSMRATSNFFHSFGERKTEGGNSPKLLDVLVVLGVQYINAGYTELPVSSS